jgi:pimeloyl-ACP methyl ester carboxylesterase
MHTVTSADGTVIAYERVGAGPPLILVDGAMCYRAAGPMRPLAQQLQNSFTVYAYDRRGRGDSSDTSPYATAREVEDLQSLIAEVGGRAHVYAMSSGGALALATAAAGPGVDRIALYEPPFTAEVGAGARNKEYTEGLHALLGAGRSGDAVALFMAHVGMPEPMIAAVRTQPAWAMLEAIAPTLAYDDTLLGGGGVPRHLAIERPMLVIGGGASPDVLRQSAQAAADAFPTARYTEIAGQTHDADPVALAPVLVEFFGS